MESRDLGISFRANLESVRRSLDALRLLGMTTLFYKHVNDNLLFSLIIIVYPLIKDFARIFDFCRPLEYNISATRLDSRGRILKGTA